MIDFISPMFIVIIIIVVVVIIISISFFELGLKSATGSPKI